MKTKLDIDEGVVRRLEQRALAEGRTVSELVETALRAFLGNDDRTETRERPPLPVCDGGGRVVDAGDRATMYELFDLEDPLIQEVKSWSKRDGKDTGESS